LFYKTANTKRQKRFIYVIQDPVTERKA